MKIYFTASLTGKKYYEKNYRLIIKTIKELGYGLITENILLRTSKDVLRETSEQAAQYHKKMLRRIKKADIIITEVSHPSTGIGYEIALAFNEGKPIINLYVRGRKPYLLESSQSDKLQVIEYELNNSFPKILKRALEDARDQMDVRFNFFISSQIGVYLNWISKHKKIPRAVFLRRLIKEHMAKNKEYKS